MSRRIRVTCYCSFPMGTIEINDGQTGLQFTDVQGVCEICNLNNHDFKKSPHWKEKPRDEVWLKSAHGVKPIPKQDEFKDDDQPEKPQPKTKRRVR